MSHRATIILLPRAQQDIFEALKYYRGQGGAGLGLKWVHALEETMHSIAENSASGSPRYAEVLKLEGLRHKQTSRFPYLIFYIERMDQVEIWRVLHGHRDFPAWLQADGGTS